MTARRASGVAMLVLLAVGLAGCGGERSSLAPSSPDYSGCRTTTRARAFRTEIAAARPLVRRMKQGFAAPGLAIAVAVDGRIVWAEACGYANRKLHTPVTARTAFRIGSVSKTLTATAAAVLVQDRRLDLDAPIQRYVPGFPTKQYRVTVRELLAHTAGIRHYEGGEALSQTHYTSVTDSLRVFAHDALLFEPGTQYRYSSYGFNLVGAAIESITGQAFAAAMQRLVMQPFGMTRTAIDDRRRHRDWASVYEVTNARTAIPAPNVDLSNRWPSGGVRSTARDLARFGSLLGDERFLDKTTQAAFFREQRLRDGTSTHYGLGFEVGDSPFGQVVGHTGNVVGGTAFLLAAPRERVAMAMTTNIGYTTASAPPDVTTVPDPPRLFIPFVRRAGR